MQKSDAKLDEARVYALLQSRGEPMTANEIADALGITPKAAQSAIRRLNAIGKTARAGEYKRGQPTTYRVVNATPAQQRQQQAEQWRGVDWSVATMRPGCLDHERHGSLQPDGSVRPYAPPQYYATSSVAQVRER